MEGKAIVLTVSTSNQHSSKFSIVSYSQACESLVRDLNRRLRTGGIPLSFPTSYMSEWLPHLKGRDIYQEYFLVIDKQGYVRGGYIIKHQKFFIRGKVLSVADFQFPLSEGIADKKYMMVAVVMYKEAIKNHPIMYGLGGGGLEEKSQRFLTRAGWFLHPVPFFFKVLKPNNFLKNIYLRKKTSKRILFDAVRFTGIGHLSFKLLNIIRSRNIRGSIKSIAERVDEFGSWVNDIWEECKSQYGFIAVRDSKTLNILYPKSSEKFIRLKILSDGAIVGWSVLLSTVMKGHKHFGDMKVGSIIDCLALQGHETDVVVASTNLLQQARADIIVSNQSFPAWKNSMVLAGYLKGPTNFFFATSPELTRMMYPYHKTVENIHMVRGDGDGPINL